MLNRQETFPGHSPFRWQNEEFATIAAIQPKKGKRTPIAEQQTRVVEQERLVELTQHDIDTIFLSSIAAIFIRSDKNSFKFKTLVDLLRRYLGDSKVQHQPEEIEEANYNQLTSLQARPAVIAALKADASLLFDSADNSARFRRILELVHSQVGDADRIDGSQIGTEALFRGNDVMANLDIGKGNNPLFKPPREIVTKEQLHEYLIKLFDLDTISSGETTTISMEWKAAEALYAARENVGVTQESTVRIQMQRPDRAFLYCYLFGTKNPSLPADYQEMAERFEQIYLRMQHQGLKSPAALERLRGWTPENGAKDPEKVNGGFQGDTIFFQEILFNSIDGVKKETSEFEAEATHAVALVRGEPVLFMDTLRKLADILSRKERNLPFPENATTQQWREVQGQLVDVFSDHPQKDAIFSGHWFDASSERNPSYQIDEAAILFYIYANKALLLPPTMVQ